MDYIVVLATFKDKEEAKKVAEKLIKEKLAACVNIVSNIESVYEWEGEIVKDFEALAIIKTKSQFFDDLKDRIKELHSYEIPEIIALDIKKGDFKYLDWIDKALI